MFENPRRDRQARNFTTNAPKILDLKLSSEQIFSKNWRWVPLRYFSVYCRWGTKKCFTKGIKTLYCISVSFCSPFFCIPVRIEIEKKHWLLCFQHKLEYIGADFLFQQHDWPHWNRTHIYYSVLHQKFSKMSKIHLQYHCGHLRNIAAVSCLIHFKIDWHSSIIPIEWSGLSTVISNKSVSILLLTRKAVSKSKTTSSYLSIYFGFLKDFIHY